MKLLEMKLTIDEPSQLPAIRMTFINELSQLPAMKLTFNELSQSKIRRIAVCRCDKNAEGVWKP